MDAIRAALIAIVLIAGGCHATRTFVVHPALHVNHDRRVYLVVRVVKEEQFLSDPYQRIADLVFPSAPDASVKLVRLVEPGRDAQVKLALPDDQPFAVYALFSDPGDGWRVLVTPPLQSRYDVLLDRDRLVVRTPQQSRLAARTQEATAAQVSSASPPSLDTSSASAPSLDTPNAPSLDTPSVSQPSLAAPSAPASLPGLGQ
jgi:hypothetical protein